MTDFASEFKKVFGNSCPPQTDWNQPRFFDSLNSDCYGSEAALMASLTSEAYRKIPEYLFITLLKNMIQSLTRYSVKTN